MRTIAILLVLALIAGPAFAGVLSEADLVEIRRMQVADTAVISAVVAGVLAWLLYIFTREPRTASCVITPTSPSCTIGQ